MLLLLRLEKFASLRWREFFWKIKKWSTIERLIYCYSHGIGTTADPAEVEYWQKQKLLTPPISLNDFIASHADNAPAK